jgi:type III restriction enzyme
MTLKTYQQNAVSKLLAKAQTLLGKNGTRICVLKAPTGSGKTIMAAEFLRQLSNAETTGRYAFVWISSNNLHVQSKKKLQDYLADSRYSFALLDELSDNRFSQNQIVFVNWESLIKQDRTTGEFTNLFMRESEFDRNLPNVVANTKKDGLEIVLIVDESHYHYWSKKSQELVQGVIGPKLILEISATPAVVPSVEEIEAGDAGYVSVRFEDVVKEGMIKTTTVINEAIAKYSDFKNTEDRVILDAALAKREQLAELYRKEGINVNPLLLIQLPSESKTMSALDASKLMQIEDYLREKGITVNNEKLGVWLSDRHDPAEIFDEVSYNDSPIEVLIFKQAIALGWDCPRAQILLMFRDIKVERFEIQTVGRIMRMPQAKHYEQETLNQAYVYTNLPRVTVAHDGDSEGYFKIHRAVRKDSYKPVNLQSIYLSRIDYGDLTLAFRKLFYDEANKYFGITEKDSPAQAKKKADIKLDLLPEELTRVIISDAVIENLDEQAQKEAIGRDKAIFAVHPSEIKRAYEAFAKLTSLPFAPVRSHTKIQMAIYAWFDKFLGYEPESRLVIQRIVVCSEENQKIFKHIIDRAKERFKEVDKKEKEAKQRRKEYVWNVPEVEYFNENYELVDADKAIMVSTKDVDKVLLYSKRTQPEKDFEALLENKKSKSVVWWYKNGKSLEQYFAVAYTDPDTGFESAFYPDYIVGFKDGTIGIYDTKSGFTAKDAKPKAEALARYIKAQNKKGKKLIGGIVQPLLSAWYLSDAEKYDSADKDQWKPVDFS